MLVAGIAELGFGFKRRTEGGDAAAIGSGASTALAGLFFILNPHATYSMVTSVVMAWLFIRGAWVFAIALRSRSTDRSWPWVALSGAADLLLGVGLALGLQITALAVALFGPTPRVVALFAAILATSFLITGASQVAIAITGRRAVR